MVESSKHACLYIWMCDVCTIVCTQEQTCLQIFSEFSGVVHSTCIIFHTLIKLRTPEISPINVSIL